MTDHDPLCRQTYWKGGDCFDCRLIAKVRADERERVLMEEIGDEIRADRKRERERIAQAIEADRDSANRGMTPPAWFAGMDNAAGVARNGGGDE